MHGELTKSVLAVPPLARKDDLTLDVAANTALIRYLESGGVTTLMYGGNANVYNMSPSEYPQLLDMLLEACSADTWIIPAVGPDFGKMMDQAKPLRERRFPTTMALPPSGIFTQDGGMDGLRRFADAFGGPVIAYLRSATYLTPEAIAELMEEGTVTAIKYAIVLDEPGDDPFLERLLSMVDKSRVISGMGERPAIVHWTKFGLRAFTSGSVCLAPRLSTAMLTALKGGDITEAERLRQAFLPFEYLRDTINPIRVLHDGVSLAEIAATGPALPLLSNLDAAQRDRVEPVARALAALNGAAMSETAA